MKRMPTSLLVAALVLIMPALAVALPQIPSEKYESSAGCVCHSELRAQWRKSLHSQALTDPLYQFKLKQAEEATNGEIGPFCTSCHSPIAVMAGELAGSDLTNVTDAGMEGVTCDFCHQVDGVDGDLGNMSALMKPDRTKRAQFDDAISPAHATAYSAFHETAEFCGNCHNVNHPGNGMHLEATYTEWKNSSYADSGIVCQDCHMTPGPGVTKPNSGKAASSGPERPHIYTMTFTGANVALGDKEVSTALLESAATLEIATEDIVPAGSTVELVTTITNIGAGHYLPTGLTEVRQMWLEVTATDKDGTELYSMKREFGTVLKDEAGSYPVELWNAAGIQADDRIPPGEVTSNDHSFPMGDGPVQVSAALYYRSASEEMAQAAGVNVPTVTMVENTTSIYNDEAQKLAAQATQPDDEAGDVPTTSSQHRQWIPYLLAGLGVGMVAGVAIWWRRRAS